MTAPKPNNPPTTLAALYYRETGQVADEARIRELLEGLPVGRKKVVSLYLKGYSYSQIAQALRVGRKKQLAKATIQSRVRFAMRLVYRTLTGDTVRWKRDYTAYRERKKGQ